MLKSIVSIVPSDWLSSSGWPRIFCFYDLKPVVFRSIRIAALTTILWQSQIENTL